MKRYEFKDGKSEKFWEINVEDTSFTVRYGKIGANGQTSTKTYADAEKAQKEADKMIASKLKKGYEFVSEDEGASTVAVSTGATSNPELEAAIHKNPNDLDAWQVYGDWLGEQEDVRGELIAIEISLAKGSDAKLEARRDELIAKHKDEWLGKELAKAADQADSNFECSWKYGFLHEITLAEPSWDGNGPDLGKQARELLKQDAAKFVRKIALGPVNMEDGEGDWSDAVTALSKAGKIPSVRELVIGEFDYEDCEISWSDMGNPGKLWPCYPNLEKCKIHGGGIELGTLEHAELRELTIETGGLPASAAKSVGAAKLPKLERLVVWFGAEEYGASCEIKHIKDLFAGKGLPKLTHLGLQNSEFEDEIAIELGSAPIVKQLKSLDLSMGTMSDRGGDALIEAKDHFAHLESINVENNFLSDSCVGRLQEAFGDKINIGEQEDDEDGEYRFVTVGE